MFRSRSAAAVLPLASLALVPLAAAAQQTLALAAPDADRIVITSTRQPTREAAQLSDVTVIDRSDIERAAGRTLAELLAQQPGMQFTSNGGLGKSASLFIRGMESRHVLLLIDGVRHGSATLGQPSIENIPLEAIDRIEIVRGPLSSLYGSEAAGGVVQVFTRQGREGLHPNASIGAGSRGYWMAAGGAGFGQGAWTGEVQVEHQQNRGFSSTNERNPFGNFNPDDDPFRQNAASLNLGVKLPADWTLRLHALHSEGRTHIDDGPSVDSLAGQKDEVAGLELSGHVNPLWQSSLRVSQSVNAYDTLRTDPSSFTDLGTIRTTQQQWTWENTVATPLGSALVLAEHLSQHVTKPGGDYDVTRRHIDALALGLNGRQGAHTWQASVRHDRNSQYGHENTGALAYGYDLSPQWRVGAAAGKTFVAPSFNQLYWPSFGNPLLKPEHGQHREINARWLPAEGHELRLAAYRNRVRGYIVEGQGGGNVPYASFNGATLAYDGSWAGWLLHGSLDHVNPVNEVTGQPLTRRPKNSLKLGAEGRWHDATYGATFIANSMRWDQQFDSSFNAVPVQLAGYATLDLHASWRVAPDWTVQASLNNIADRRYETALGYNQPGRELYVTLRWAPR